MSKNEAIQLVKVKNIGEEEKSSDQEVMESLHRTLLDASELNVPLIPMLEKGTNDGNSNRSAGRELGHIYQIGDKPLMICGK